MTDNQITIALGDCEKSVRSRFDFQPARDPEASWTRDRARHLLWMVGQAKGFVAEGKRDKAFRWLGFLQGSLWVLGIQSIEASKKSNAPAGETFDKARI